MLLYQVLASNIPGKIKVSHIKAINLKYQLQHGMINLNCLMNQILYQIIKIILSTSSKNMKHLLVTRQEYTSTKLKTINLKLR